MISFTLDDYESFRDLLKKGRGRYLYIQGDRCVFVDYRSTKSRNDELQVKYYTMRTLPHYEGLLNEIEKTAQAYSERVNGGSRLSATTLGNQHIL